MRWLRRTVAAAVLTVGVGAACDEGSPLLPPSPGDEVVVAFGRDVSHYPTADWRLRSASLDGDRLVLEIQHAGGCAEHRYWLLATQGFTTLPTAGPIETVAVTLRLAHDDGGDACEALLTPTLRWSLEPLRAAWRNRSPTGTVRIFLRIPESRGSSELRTVTWEP